MEEARTTYTVDDALLSVGFGKFQALILVYAGMGWVAEAMEIMLLSFVGSSVQEEWNITPNKESLLTSVVFGGMMVGAYSGGVVSDNYGRRKGFLFTSLVTAVAGFLSSFSPNYICLITSRFIVGIGLGGAHVFASWFLEFIPAPNRGTWMAVYQISWTVGTILEASLAWFIMPTLGWRWLLAVSSLPAFVLLLFYNIAPESPRYLSMRSKADAVCMLEKMARMNKMMLPHGTFTSDPKSEFDINHDSSETTPLITHQICETSTISKDTKTEVGLISVFYKLLSPKLARTTLLLWIVYFGNAFAYYGIVLLTSELTIKCNWNAPLLSVSKDNSYRDIFVTSFAELPGLLLSAAIVDRIGRRPSMLIFLFTNCFLLIPLFWHQNELLTTSLLFGARACIMGSFSILYVYAPEVYPTSLRTTGVGVANAISRIGAMICPLVAVGLVKGCYQIAAISLFEIVIFLTGLAIMFFPLETKGRRLTDTL
ncbi:organic cation/carnitine transporter 7-like isoform X1 [Zingiber officinale]|nr:organic cation/carnitine transporter 7-like isoform X1 [Zingiber officinale]